MDNDIGNFVSGTGSGADDGKERFKIIYVDDVPSSLVTLKRRLSAWHEVYPAESSAVMFSALEKITPDLILLDVNMPGSNGYETIKNLKTDERYAHIPVIFFTSSNDRKSVVKGISLGAVDYLIKPFETHSLVECIEKHVKESRSGNVKGDSGRPHILAVDDVVSELKIIKEILHTKYIVHTISKAESVLDFLRIRIPDLILLDYLMPVYNGFELMVRIREIKEYRDIPIIMLTSDGTASHVVEAISLGVCNFIVKPFKENELIEKVAKHIKKI